MVKISCADGCFAWQCEVPLPHGITGRIRGRLLPRRELTNRPPDCSACFPAGPRPLILFLVPEQSELRRIARGLGQAEMLEGMAGKEAPARRALDEAALDQERFD